MLKHGSPACRARRRCVHSAAAEVPCRQHVRQEQDRPRSPAAEWPPHERRQPRADIAVPMHASRACVAVAGDDDHRQVAAHFELAHCPRTEAQGDDVNAIDRPRDDEARCDREPQRVQRKRGENGARDRSKRADQHQRRVRRCQDDADGGRPLHAAIKPHARGGCDRPNGRDARSESCR